MTDRWIVQRVTGDEADTVWVGSRRECNAYLTGIRDEARFRDGKAHDWEDLKLRIRNPGHPVETLIMTCDDGA